MFPDLPPESMKKTYVIAESHRFFRRWCIDNNMSPHVARFIDRESTFFSLTPERAIVVFYQPSRIESINEHYYQWWLPRYKKYLERHLEFARMPYEEEIGRVDRQLEVWREMQEVKRKSVEYYEKAKGENDES